MSARVQSTDGALRPLWALFVALVGVHFRRERTRSLLTLGGVALGVAVVVAISLANEATLANFRSTVERLAGRTELEVVPFGPWLDERLLAPVVQTRGVRFAAPRIELKAAAADRPEEVVTILGIDIVNDAFFRDYWQAMEGTPSDAEAEYDGEDSRIRAELLEVIQDPRSILISQSLAARLDLVEGDPFVLKRGGRDVETRIAGLLTAEGAGALLDGNIAVMDIAPVQDRFGLRGRLSGIDIIPDAGADLDALAAALRDALPPDALVRRPAQRGESVDKMLAAFRYNLTALAYIALVVGVFLIFNTVSVSVVRRREEIGTLRALGAPRRGILAAFLAEGAAFGVVGAMLGVGFGQALAQVLLAVMNEAIGFHWGAATTGRAAFRWDAALVGGGAAVALSLVASLLPALEAASVPPANTMRAGTIERRRSGHGGWSAPIGAVLLGVAWLCAGQDAVGGLPLFGFLAAFALIAGFTSLAPVALRAMVAVLASVYRRVLGATGDLAVAAVEGARSRAVVAVSGLMIGMTMVVSLGVMVGSFRSTVATWLGQTLQADLFVAPADIGLGAGSGLPSETVARLEAQPEVRYAASFRVFRAEFRGFPVNVAAADFRVGIAMGHVPILGGDGREILAAAKRRDEVVVSETFAYRHGLVSGDSIQLPAGDEPRDFRIAGIYTDYSSDLGFITMDVGLFERSFGASGIDSLSIFVEDGVDAGALRDRLAAEFDFRQPVTISTSGELRRSAIAIFDKTFAITYVLMAIAVIVSILGVATTLLAAVIDRRRELTTLRFIGMSRLSLGRVVMYESSILALGGIALGIACGALLSLLLIYVINKQSFGWTIQFAPPYPQLAAATALLFVCTLAAGLLPARRAGRIDLRYRK